MKIFQKTTEKRKYFLVYCIFPKTLILDKNNILNSITAVLHSKNIEWPFLKFFKL